MGRRAEMERKTVVVWVRWWRVRARMKVSFVYVCVCD
jgi:hypothetical protein